MPGSCLSVFIQHIRSLQLVITGVWHNIQKQHRRQVCSMRSLMPCRPERARCCIEWHLSILSAWDKSYLETRV